MKKSLVTSVFLTVFVFCFSEGNRQVYLSLKECFAIGLENNYSVLISKNNQRRLSDNLTIGNAGLLARISLSAQNSGVINNTRQNLFDGTVNTTSGIHNLFNNASINLHQTFFAGFGAQNTYRMLKEVVKVW